jgi:hypothetical protein
MTFSAKGLCRKNSSKAAEPNTQARRKRWTTQPPAFYLLHRRTVDLNPAPSALLCDGFPAILNILNEHHECPAIPLNIDHSYVVRTRPASDFDDGVCRNSHSDSLVIDRLRSGRVPSLGTVARGPSTSAVCSGPLVSRS